jgi:hypothetical protein
MRLKPNKFSPLLMMGVLFSLLISACGVETPTIDIMAEKTGFAQTANVQMTQTAEAVPTATYTPQPTMTEATPQESSPTDEVLVSLTPTTSVTAMPVEGEDGAAWRENDPPDNTEFTPGETFTVTWKLENTGTSTWTTNYYIQYFAGELIGSSEKIYLPYEVPQGTSVTISAEFVAPETTGEKQSIWQLFNADEEAFYEFYIVVNVVEPGGE